MGCEIQIEPGRFIVGNAGILVSEVIYKKFGLDREFLILDSAMNDLVRPTMYQAYHEIIPILEHRDRLDVRQYDVVGPVCETGDIFASQRTLSEMEAGDLVAIMSAGAYAANEQPYNLDGFLLEICSSLCSKQRDGLGPK